MLRRQPLRHPPPDLGLRVGREPRERGEHQPPLEPPPKIAPRVQSLREEGGPRLDRPLGGVGPLREMGVEPRHTPVAGVKRLQGFHGDHPPSPPPLGALCDAGLVTGQPHYTPQGATLRFNGATPRGSRGVEVNRVVNPGHPH